MYTSRWWITISFKPVKNFRWVELRLKLKVTSTWMSMIAHYTAQICTELKLNHYVDINMSVKVLVRAWFDMQNMIGRFIQASVFNEMNHIQWLDLTVDYRDSKHMRLCHKYFMIYNWCGAYKLLAYWDSQFCINCAMHKYVYSTPTTVLLNGKHEECIFTKFINEQTKHLTFISSIHWTFLLSRYLPDCQ